ncbi:MAG: Nudix family hydrolase [Acidiferrobacter sp.]
MSASTDPTEPKRVVAGIIQDRSGRVLVARRPIAKTGGGLWEFPGGKVQSGESEDEALRRELDEELGIVAGRCEPLPHFRANPPPSIALSFWRIQNYKGTPHGREGQAVQWCPVEGLPDLPFLAADIPIFARLRLPPLYLISNVDRLGEELFEKRLRAALTGGARLLQLREPWPTKRLCAYATRLRDLCAQYGARCVVNGDPDETRGCADGVHLSSARLWRLSARPLPPDQLVGASCHNARDLQRAAEVGCDFAVLSPVQPTLSHPEAVPLGWSRFRELAGSIWLPVYALGGMREGDRVQAHQALAQGVALRSAVFGDLEEA